MYRPLNHAYLLTGTQARDTILVQRVGILVVLGRFLPNLGPVHVTRVPGHFLSEVIVKSVQHGPHIVLPPQIEVMMNRAVTSATKSQKLVYIKHAVEYGFNLTYDPMPRRGFDLIGVATPSGVVAWLTNEITRLGAQCTQNASKSG